MYVRVYTNDIMVYGENGNAMAGVSVVIAMVGVSVVIVQKVSKRYVDDNVVWCLPVSTPATQAMLRASTTAEICLLSALLRPGPATVPLPPSVEGMVGVIDVVVVVVEVVVAVDVIAPAEEDILVRLDTYLFTRAIRRSNSRCLTPSSDLS